MAEIIPNLIAHFLIVPEIYALLADRISEDDIPDGQAYPHAVLSQPATQKNRVHNGDPSRIATVQMDIFGETLDSVAACANAVENAMDEYKGMMGDIKAGYVFVTPRSMPKVADQKKYHRLLELEIATNS